MATARFPSASWAPMQAPSLKDFEALAEVAYARLPELFRQRCGNLVIFVEDFPEDEVIEAMELETPFDILGLFHGHGLPEMGFTPETGQGANMIWLYRRPILDYWAENEETLGAVISHVLIHEIGHHFGLSDDDMARIEAEAL